MKRKSEGGNPATKSGPDATDQTVADAALASGDALWHSGMTDAEVKTRKAMLASWPDLYDALQSAIKTIRTWHGMGFVGRSVDDPGRSVEAKAWEIYRTHAPEMKLLYAALAKARGENSTSDTPVVPERKDEEPQL